MCAAALGGALLAVAYWSGAVSASPSSPAAIVPSSSPSSVPSATPVPTLVTSVLADVQVHSGQTTSIAYRVDDPSGVFTTATVDLTVQTKSGVVKRHLVHNARKDVGVKLVWRGRLTLPAGHYVLVVHAVDGNGQPQAVATTKRLLMLRTLPPLVPTAEALRNAAAWAAGRADVVSWAVVDSRGTLHGFHATRECQSASVVKSMLLVAYLRHHHSVSSGMSHILMRMIDFSDNSATDVVYGIVGRSGLVSLARTAHMRGFHPNGGWITTRIMAADMARFFRDMEQYVPRRYRSYANGLLSSITPSQRWGIPPAAEPLGYHVYFKGGWLGDYILANQAARLERGNVTLGLAVFTDDNPPSHYGLDTITGVTSRLLKR